MCGSRNNSLGAGCRGIIVFPQGRISYTYRPHAFVSVMGSRKSLVLGTFVILHVLCGNKKFEFVKQYFYIDFASNEIKVMP